VSGLFGLQNLTLEVEEAGMSVSALLLVPERPRFLYVLGHGAGAGMRHSFMESVAGALANRDVATVRYQFPYMEGAGRTAEAGEAGEAGRGGRGRRRPDPPGVLEATVRAAVDGAREALPDLPMIAGGKSMGGRMTSQAQSKERLPGVQGLAFLGFPLHAPKKPDDKRATHLLDVKVPMLFLQGTRDTLADLELLTPVCDRLGDRATLHVVDGGDHSFKVLKRSGRTDEEVLDELAHTISKWADRILGEPA
jgi:predicted alpha/beta-hydrolase family hydrolase